MIAPAMARDTSAEDTRIRELCDASRWDDAATLWIETHGPDVLTFLGALRSPEVDLDEVFGQFCEDVWRGMKGFRWECGPRTWSYRLARNAWNRALKSSRRRGRRVVALADAPRLSQVAAAVRSTTQVHQRTTIKDRFSALREHLELDDQMLLIVRVDRGLEWPEVARVMIEEGVVDDDPAELRRVSARLRKQFQRVKERLRALAERDGLLDET